MSDSVHFESNGVDDETFTLHQTTTLFQKLIHHRPVIYNYTSISYYKISHITKRQTIIYNQLHIMSTNNFHLLPPSLGFGFGVFGEKKYYKNKGAENFGSLSLLANRISCLLSLAGNSCLASLEGIHSSVQHKQNQ